MAAESDILSKAVSFMSGMINGVESWSDRIERFNEWTITTKMITASVLSRVNRFHPALDNVWELWAKITESAFENGGHNLYRELKAFKEITGIISTKRDSKLNKLYPLALLSATKNNLSPETEKAYLQWIWDNNEGIYYLTWFSLNIFPEITSKAFPFWLKAIDIFSDFIYGKTLAKDSVNYLWSLRGKDGLWDFGNNSKSAGYARTSCGWQLSEDWRNPINRQLDCTLRILLLLKKHPEQG